jgi:hypothetical protein
MPDYDPQSDFWSSLTLAIAEIRRRKVIAGEYQPINDEERQLAEGAKHD